MLSIRKIVDSYFSKRTFPHWCVLLLDSAILFFVRSVRLLVLQPWHRPSAELLAVDLPDAAVRRRPLHILCHLPDIFGNHPLLIVQRPHPCGAGDGMLRIGGDSRPFLHEQLPVSGVRPRAGAAYPDCGSHRDRFDVAASRFYQMGL